MEHVYCEREAGHDFGFWNEEFPRALQWAFCSSRSERQLYQSSVVLPRCPRRSPASILRAVAIARLQWAIWRTKKRCVRCRASGENASLKPESRSLATDFAHPSKIVSRCQNAAWYLWIDVTIEFRHVPFVPKIRTL